MCCSVGLRSMINEFSGMVSGGGGAAGAGSGGGAAGGSASGGAGTKRRQQELALFCQQLKVETAIYAVVFVSGVFSVG